MYVQLGTDNIASTVKDNKNHSGSAKEDWAVRTFFSPGCTMNRMQALLSPYTKCAMARPKASILMEVFSGIIFATFKRSCNRVTVGLIEAWK